MRNVLGYVLRDDKVKEGYIDITGPFNYDEISCDNVYQAFLDEKRLSDGTLWEVQTALCFR